MNRKIVIALILMIAAICCPAAAKDFGFIPTLDGGMVWFFLYDNSARTIDIAPAPAYGASIVQVVDFDWARNMLFEVSYFHSKSRGEWDPMNGSKFLFDLTADYASGNIGYMFLGRRVHPYISGGFGATHFKYEERDGKTIKEMDTTINAGAGADWTLWEPKGGADQINLGGRVRYVYVLQREIVDAGINAINVMVRFSIRF